jgi:hypothetical protein
VARTSRVLTVRFTYRGEKLRIIGAGYWRRPSNSMSGKTVGYSKGETAKVRIVEDFLPPPSQLVPRDDKVKVTLSLSRRSIDFFKREARSRRVPYQKMIRALVDHYVERQAR